MTEKKILILGTNIFAPVAADLISEVPGYRVCGFIENLDRSRCGQPLEQWPVYWIDETRDLAADHWAVCCLGTTKRSLMIEQAAALGFRFATIVHPTAHISAQSSLGPGCLVGPGVIISAHTHLGPHVRVNRGVLIGHDTTIGEYATIQPGANIAGKCRVDRCCYIGMSAVLLDGISVGCFSVVAAGAVVIKDLPPRVMAAGVPAKIIKENIDGK